jgi:hypothetical protein
METSWWTASGSKYTAADGGIGKKEKLQTEVEAYDNTILHGRSAHCIVGTFSHQETHSYVN